MMHRLSKLGLCLSAALLLPALSCQRNDLPLRETSVVSAIAQTDLDRYVEQAVTSPYNIEVSYRYKEYEIDRSWVTIPARTSNSLQFVNVLKYLFLEPYTEVMGLDSVRLLSPQELVLNGALAYNPPPSRSNTRAFTINGVKIVFMNINEFDFPTLRSYYDQLDELQASGATARYNQLNSWVQQQNQEALDRLRTNYLRTIYHESAHTYHQRIEPNRDFHRISSLDYRQADWFNGWTREGKNFLHYGFITAYASQEPDEDFAELFANYIILTPAEWEARLVEANVTPEGRSSTGRQIIERKFKLLSDYLEDNWRLNIDTLRSHVQRRYPEFSRQDFSQMTLNTASR